MSQSPSSSTPPTARGSLLSIDPAQRQRDLEHLKILAILHYIFGGLTALASCAGIFYVVLGIIMAANPSAFDDPSGNTPPPPGWIGGMMASLGGCIILISVAMSILVIYAGRCLARQRNRVFCMVVAGVMCISIPLGTLLGVFTLIVLARPSVMAEFAQRRALDEMAQP